MNNNIVAILQEHGIACMSDGLGVGGTSPDGKGTFFFRHDTPLHKLQNWLRRYGLADAGLATKSS